MVVVMAGDGDGNRVLTRRSSSNEETIGRMMAGHEPRVLRAFLLFATPISLVLFLRLFLLLTEGFFRRNVRRKGNAINECNILPLSSR